MPGVEVPPPIRQGPGNSSGAAGHELHLALPAWLRGWAPALTLWRHIDERRFTFTQDSLGQGPGGSWVVFIETATGADLVEQGQEPGTWVLRPDWVSALESGLEGLGGRPTLLPRLVDAWRAGLDPGIAGDIAAWAADLEEWTTVEEAWVQLNIHSEFLTAPTLALYRDLPPAARQARPLLTWATNAAAGALAAARPGAEVVVVPQQMMADAAMLHANWQSREDTNTAVHAGTLRMLGQRRQPGTRPGEALEAAWRTKEEVEAFIDARSREGRSPSGRTQAVFRAFSAQLAMFRANSLDAVTEARWAELLADVEPVRVLAQGVEALALSYSVQERPDVWAGAPPERLDPPLGIRGMRGMGQAFLLLADGNDALGRLELPALERVLGLVSAEEAAFAGVWAIRSSLEAFRQIFWGDVAEGIDALSTDVAHWSRFSREQDEPLGRAMIGRARTLLLTKSGAFGAVMQDVDPLPEGLRLLPLARMHLWAGKLREAIRVADAGAYDQGRGLSDRHRLLFVKAAAALLDRSCDAELRGTAIKELGHLLEREQFAPIGALPKPARDAIVELGRPEWGDHPNFALLLERLSLLNDSGGEVVMPARLTERERVLLPMLATDDPVPEIARKLQVSVNTVRKQVVTLREKFKAETRTELIRKARNYGALP